MVSLGIIEPMAVFSEGYQTFPFLSTRSLIHIILFTHSHVRLRSAIEIVELLLKTDKNVYSRPREEVV